MMAELALDLAFEQIVLLGHRDGRWYRIGTARHDNSQFAAQSRRLLTLARAWTGGTGGSPGCYVILPDDQVLRVAVPLQGAARQEVLSPDALARRLQSVSPDPVFTLRYDWRLAEDRVQFAALPLSMLQEAETFVRSLGFRSCGGLAAAGSAGFTGTAWFGTTGARSDGVAHAGPNGQDVVSLDRREIAAHLPENMQEGVTAAADALDRSRRAARIDPAHLQPLADETLSGPAGRLSLARQIALRLRPRMRSSRRIAVLSAALVAALAAASVWFPDEQTSTPDRTASIIADTDEIAEPKPDRLHLPTAEETAEGAEAEEAKEPAGTELADAEVNGNRAAVGYYTPSPALMRGAEATDDLLAEMTVPGLDPALGTDALALKHVTLPDPGDLPPVLSLPPSPDRTYAVDARGLVIPSPEGRETPEGYLVVAGPPPTRPAQRPDQLQMPEEPSAPQVTDRASLPVGDPLRALDPRPRPADLVAQHERSMYGGRTQSELTALRPQAKPESLQESAGETTVATASAVSGAPRPGLRPAGLKQRAMRTALKTEPAPASSSPAAAVSRGNQPALPSSASITEQATARNMIDLSKVSLLGTFGKSGSMRALVRMPGGEVVNVAVGDRMDGGRVQSIGQRAVTYVKRGQAVTLQMPSG